MVGGLSMAEMSVFHTREIVLDESHIVDLLNGTGGGHGHGFSAADELQEAMQKNG